MHNFEDIIEKYKRELMEFSRQVPVHTESYEETFDKVYRETAEVMAQPQQITEQSSRTNEPTALIKGNVLFANYDDFMSKNSARGLLRVQVFSADRSFPVPNATVRVYVPLEDGERELYSGLTDVDGVVDDISLPAPDSSVSFDENSTIAPYATYILRVDRAEYVPSIFNGIPVFDSVKSIQPVGLIPLSSDGKEPLQTVIPAETTTLFGGER